LGSSILCGQHEKGTRTLQGRSVACEDASMHDVRMPLFCILVTFATVASCAGTPTKGNDSALPPRIETPAKDAGPDDAAVESADADADAGSLVTAANAEPFSDDPRPKVTPYRVKFVNLLTRTMHVVRARVKKVGTGQRRDGGGKVVYTYAHIDVLEIIRGDASNIFPKFRKTFPLWGNEVSERGHKIPDSDHIDPMATMKSFEGQERIFFVSLPSESYSTSVSWGPPPEIRNRWGEEQVPMAGHVGVEELDEVRAAIREFEAEQAWVKRNAARIEESDLFEEIAGAAMGDQKADPTRFGQFADAIAARISAELTKALGARVDLGTVKTSDVSDQAKFAYPLQVQGAADLNSDLTIMIKRSSGRLRMIQVSPPIVRRLCQKHPSNFDKVAFLAQVKNTLKIRFKGGVVEERVSLPFRGDGANCVHVEMSAGTVHRGSSSHSAGSLRMGFTSEGLALFEYHNDWAR
jgi:hypothetical protein